MFSQDNTPPDRAYIDYVTVDTASNNTLIFWTKSKSSDVEWYNLYYEIQTPNGFEGVKFDSVSADFSNYIHIDGGAEAGSVLYSVSAQDSSGNESLRTPGLHSTIYVKQDYDSCENIMSISWNKYIGWDVDISGYIIHWRTDAGSFRPLIGVNPEDSLFLQYEIQNNTNYYYLIEAIRNDGVRSLSPISKYYTYMAGPPENLTLDLVTVASQNLVEINFNYTDTSNLFGFALLRSSEKSSDFQLISQIENPNANNYTFRDSVLTKVESFYYKVASLNSCGKPIKESNYGTNILLLGENQDTRNLLTWTEYEDFPLGLEEYQLFRKNAAGIFEALASFPPGSANYSDFLPNAYNLGISGNMEYLLKAKSIGSDTLSYSNILSIPVKSELIMPNAFTPNNDGKNDSFKPVISFIPDDYQMIIYDRYGVIVFQTEDPNLGWDGNIKGKGMANEGVYVYHIQFTSENGTATRNTGKVTVIYP